MTKIEKAWLKHMVDEAFDHPRKIGKLLRKLDERAKESKERSKADWDLMFDYYARYQPLIELEIEHRRQANPNSWTYRRHTHTPKLESAPWYKAVHGAA